VLHGLELVERLAADAPRRGVGRDEIGVLPLELLQFAEQTVVLGIGDDRPILHVVRPVVPPDLFTQRFDALLRVPSRLRVHSVKLRHPSIANEGRRRLVAAVALLFSQPASSSRAVAHTSSNMSSVSVPVNVFCWLGW